MVARRDPSSISVLREFYSMHLKSWHQRDLLAAMPHLSSALDNLSVPLVNYYYSSIYREPSRNVRLPIRSYGGNLALRMVAEDHGKLFALVAVTLFSAAFRVMDRVQQNILPERGGTDPMAFKTAYISDLNNLAVTAALIAQLSFGAWQLPLLREVHWICKACVLCSLGFAILSAFFAVNMSRNLNSFDLKEDLKNWLSRTCSKKEQEIFYRNFKEQFPNLSSAAGEAKAAAAAQINDFIQQHKATRASFYSCLMLTLPSTLLNAAIGLFTLAVAIYLGVIYGSHLDSAEGDIASQAVLICYTTAVTCALVFFFGSHKVKDSELEVLRCLAREVEEDEVE